MWVLVKLGHILKVALQDFLWEFWGEVQMFLPRFTGGNWMPRADTTAARSGNTRAAQPPATTKSALHVETLKRSKLQWTVVCVSLSNHMFNFQMEIFLRRCPIDPSGLVPQPQPMAPLVHKSGKMPMIAVNTIPVPTTTGSQLFMSSSSSANRLSLKLMTKDLRCWGLSAPVTYRRSLMIPLAWWAPGWLLKLTTG